MNDEEFKALVNATTLEEVVAMLDVDCCEKVAPIGGVEFLTNHIRAAFEKQRIHMGPQEALKHAKLRVLNISDNATREQRKVLFSA